MSAATARPRPGCDAAQAAARMLSVVGHGGRYQLGTGDYRPRPSSRGGASGGIIDLPWTTRVVDGVTVEGADCAGAAICWAYKIVRHRPGFNRGRRASVVDHINTDSCLEDAEHEQDLFAFRDGAPELGDLLVQHTIRLPGGFYKMGHVRMVCGSRAAEWNPASPRWDLLDLVECHGPNGRAPGVVRTTGAAVARHNEMWRKPEHQYRLVRVVR